MEALDALEPSALTYQEWTAVGMALKEAGAPCEVWDTWSRRDAGRYHRGECDRKWETFVGSATPVTAGTIFDMAQKAGWHRQYGEALDWDSEITSDRIVDRHWLETPEIELPQKWDPVQQLIDYLSALFEPQEIVGYVTESWEKDGKHMPSKGVFDRTAGQLIEKLTQCGGDVCNVIGDYNRDVGAWIRFNPLDGNGCRNDNVTEFRFALVESDELDIETQNAIIRKLELPCAALVHSGGKSLHAIVRVDAPDYKEYRRRVDYLYGVCQKNGLVLDQACRNPSRLSRMPGIYRGESRQYLLATNIGKSNWDAWQDWVEGETDDLPETESIADVWDQMPELAPALIDGILRQGHKMLLAGPSKAGKSFALIELCISIAEGKRWLERFPCAQGRVLYINLELDRASCLHRFRDVYAALHVTPNHLQNIDIWNLRGAAAPMDKLVPKLIRRAKQKNYIAIIIDPIYKVITGDENSADQMSKFCNHFDSICRALGCAVIYCHHHSKGAQGGKKSMDRSSGSGVFARDPDALLDMVELEISDALREHLQKKAVCSVCMAALEAAGLRDEVSLDDEQSSAQMLEACKRLLPKQMPTIETDVQTAQADAGKVTAWRISGTLREFAQPEAVNLFFDYPIHRTDDSGVLADIQPEGAEGYFSSIGKRGSDKRWKGEQGKKDRKQDTSAALDAAFAACTSMGEKNTTVYAIAEYLGQAPKTAERKLKADARFWVEGEKVGKKA